MADLAGTNIASAIRPFASNDEYAVALANEIKGGRHCVLTLVERNAIYKERRTIGMQCFVLENSKTYELVTDPVGATTNADWKESIGGVGATGVGVKSASVTPAGNLVLTLTDDTVIDLGLIKGVDGKDGVAGINGVDGKDGAAGTNGVDGKDGAAGTNGIPGLNGIGIKSISIDVTDHLIVTLTDDSTIDAGLINVTGGIGIKSGIVDMNKHIIFTKTDDTTIDIDASSLSTSPYVHPITHNSDIIVGGYHQVADLIGRDNIPNSVKVNGMMVTVAKDIDGKPCSYRLVNGAWEPLTASAGVWGGEFATYKDLSNLATPTVDYNYIVTADENNAGERTYYNYTSSKIYTFVGSFYDRYTAGSVVAGGGVGASDQWSSANIILPGAKRVLDVTNTPNYNFIAPTVLIEEQGTQNIVTTVNEFNNGEASSFTYNSEFIEFTNGKMQLKTSFDLSKISNTTNSNCLYYRSKLSISKFKNIESVVL